MTQTHDRSTHMMECDYGCLYDERTIDRLPSAKFTGIPRCIKHGAILSWATWAYGMTPSEARKHKKQTSVGDHPHRFGDAKRKDFHEMP